MIQTNVTTISHLAKKCRTLNHLKQLHAHLLKLHLPVIPLFSFAATSRNPIFFYYARTIFQNLNDQSTFIYNTMIRGYVQQNLPLPAILCYKNMLNNSLQPNNYTFTPLIKACSIISNDKIGFLVHAHVMESGHSHDPFIVSALIVFYSSNLDMGKARKLFDEMPVRDVVLWTTMIDGYGKTGEVDKARELFDEMPERNVITWSAMIAGYSRDNQYKQVLELYTKMEEIGVKPNESILVSVLTACSHIGGLSQGIWIHSYAKQHKFENNPILATALVDMYSKCGCIELALSVFEQITFKDTGAWNAIISGVALKGDVIKALELFNNMVLNGIKPNEITFVSILTACTHANLIDKGVLLFNSMSNNYGVKPRLEHYACVIDLLARGGKLEEAEKFVKDKLGGINKGDANVYGALLNACRNYGKVEIGDRLWKKLVKMGVIDYGMYVVSYNMYKEAGWEIEAKSVRRMIEKMGMKKIPGCSVIEVNGIVEEFFVGNNLSKKGNEINQMLCSLLNVMILVEYNYV